MYVTVTFCIYQNGLIQPRIARQIREVPTLVYQGKLSNKGILEYFPSTLNANRLPPFLRVPPIRL